MKFSGKLFILWILFVGIILLWLLSFFAIDYFVGELQYKALLGDSFGVINSLFSGLAFAGIIYTILLQRKELELQRNELELTRSELKRTADAQEETLKRLNTENRISNLPLIQCNGKSELEYTFQNLSNNIVFDLEVRIFPYKQDWKEDRNEFVVKYVGEAHIKRLENRLKWAGLLDLKFKDLSIKYLSRCSSLQSNFQFTIKIPSRIGLERTKIFIQYRDILGNNYGQFLYEIPEQDFMFNEPSIPEIIERIPVQIDSDYSNKNLPHWLMKFYEFDYLSINSGILTKEKLNATKSSVSRIEKASA